MQTPDWHSLAKILEERRQWLLGLIHRRFPPSLRNRVSPEEIWSDVQVRAGNSWQRFVEKHAQGDPAARRYEPWLRRLVKCCIIDAYRRQKCGKRDFGRDVRFPEDSATQIALHLASPGTSPSGAAIRAEQAERLARAIGQLKQRDRDLLRLRYFEGMPWADVAAVLGLKASNVGVRHSRALGQLRKLLDQPPS
jgi:RNA polymerase sigma factor (sigma-70 family)